MVTGVQPGEVQSDACCIIQYDRQGQSYSARQHTDGKRETSVTNDLKPIAYSPPKRPSRCWDDQKALQGNQ